MKKIGILIAVVTLCVVGWAGATYIVGGKVESRYLGLIEQYGRYGPMTLACQSYQRGLFASGASTLLQITLPAPPEQAAQEPDMRTVQLLFEHDLHHGPLLFGAGPAASGAPSAGLALVETRLSRFDLSDEELDALLGEVPELREAVATVKIDFDGSSETLVRVPAFERQEDRARIAWGGLAFSMEFAPGDGTLKGDMGIPSLVVSSEEAVMNWNGIHGRFDLVEVLPTLYVGSSQAVFGGLDLTLPTMEDEGRQVVEVEQAEFVSESRFEDGLVGVNQLITFDGLTVGGELHYGPLILDVDMRNLDGQALSDLQMQAREVYRGAETFNPDKIAAELIPVYIRYFKRLMAGKPELDIRRLYLGTPEGEADGSFRIRLTGTPGVPLDSPAALLPALRHLDAALDVTVDESLVRAVLANKMEAALRDANSGSARDLFSEKEVGTMVEGQVGSQLEMWAAQNFIVREGRKLKTRATFKEGALLVNGKPLPLFGG